MAIIRFTDPYMQFLIKKYIYELFGYHLEEPREGINSEVLSSFLASSLNIELVYVILSGITRFSNSGREAAKKIKGDSIDDTDSMKFD